jgi:hypothetical protein
VRTRTLNRAQKRPEMSRELPGKRPESPEIGDFNKILNFFHKNTCHSLVSKLLFTQVLRNQNKRDLPKTQFDPKISYSLFLIVNLLVPCTTRLSAISLINKK